MTAEIWDWRALVTIAVKELHDARRQRWFILFAAVFAGLCLMIGASSYLSAGTVTLGSFPRTAASLVNLVVFLVPLMGLLLGSATMASEKERGTLPTLLSQPITIPEILLGKWLGVSVASSAALLIGFGLAGLALSFSAGSDQSTLFIGVFAFTLLLSLSSISIGALISSFSSRFSLSVTIALVVWLVFVLISDLGLMMGAVAFQIPVPVLFWLSALNPCQVFRLLALRLLQGDLELLGPAGAYAGDFLGPFFFPALLSVFTLWIIVPLCAALIFARRWLE